MWRWRAPVAMMTLSVVTARSPSAPFTRTVLAFVRDPEPLMCSTPFPAEQGCDPAREPINDPAATVDGPGEVRLHALN